MTDLLGFTGQAAAGGARAAGIDLPGGMVQMGWSGENGTGMAPEALQQYLDARGANVAPEAQAGISKGMQNGLNPIQAAYQYQGNRQEDISGGKMAEQLAFDPLTYMTPSIPGAGRVLNGAQKTLDTLINPSEFRNSTEVDKCTLFYR